MRSGRRKRQRGLQRCTLLAVARCAEDLQVLDRRCPAHGERDDVVVLNVDIAPAGPTTAAIAIENGPSDLDRDQLSTRAGAGFLPQGGVSAPKLPLPAALPVHDKGEHVL